MSLRHCQIILVLFFFHLYDSAKDWKDKSVGEYSEANYDNLYEEWEENDDEKSHLMSYHTAILTGPSLLYHTPTWTCQTHSL